MRSSVLSHHSLLSVLLQLVLVSTLSCDVDDSLDPEVVDSTPGIGIEFTLDYVTSAASFSNGTTVGLTKVEGTPEYKALMRGWLLLCEDVHNGTRNTPDLLDDKLRLKEVYDLEYIRWSDQRSGLQTSWSYWIRTKIFRHKIPLPSPPDRWANDTDVSTLVSMTSMVQQATERALGSQSAHFSSDTTRIAMPSYFFTADPQAEASRRTRHNSYVYNKNGVSLNKVMLWNQYHRSYSPGWYKMMTMKFPIALARANPNPWDPEILWFDREDYGSVQQSEYSPANAMVGALCSAGIDACHEHDQTPGCDLSSVPPITAIAISFSNASLSLQALRFGGSALPPVTYNTFPSLGAFTLSSHHNKSSFWEEVQSKIGALQSHIQTRDSLGDIHRVLLLGDAVNDDLRSTLEKGEVFPGIKGRLWMKDPPDPLFAAAMGVAKKSRKQIEDASWPRHIDRYWQRRTCPVINQDLGMMDLEPF